MRAIFLAGASCAALCATPALAQPAADSNAAILARLNALEAKVDALQARNDALEQELARREGAPQPAPVQASASGQPQTASGQASALLASAAPQPQPADAPPARAVAWSYVPEFRSPDGRFTFKPRGMLDIDYAGFDERRGGYDFSNGTQIRRGRFGLDGTALHEFAYRIEAEFVDNKANLLDAWIAYTRVPHFTFTVGQLKVPAGLEANSNDAFNEFVERGMANVAFGAVGGERRVGVTVAYARPMVTATVGLYGAGEAVDRNAVDPGEVWSYNGRVTFEPVNTPDRLIHVGASAYHAQHFAANSVTLGSRPNVNEDGGYLEQIALAGTDPRGGPETGIRDATFYGLEGAGVLGPVSVQGEYSHMHLNRFDAAPSLNFDGYYVFGSLFLTGESRTFEGGSIGRLNPRRPFDPAKGQWGAFELALRYDRLNLTDHALSPLDHDAHSWTAALNWYLTGHVKMLFNYIRFTGANSPLVASPIGIDGTTAAGDAFVTRLHLDF